MKRDGWFFGYLCVVKLLLVDNYDSFTWNLFHYLIQMSEKVEVIRNDDERCFDALEYDGVVISPGPGIPAESGHTPAIIGMVAGKRPLLGVCLGHQAIVEHYGGSLVNLPTVLHGKQRTTRVLCTDAILFGGLPETFSTGHYHSWVGCSKNFPAELRVTAETRDGAIMAFEHKHLSVMGLQFHPESVLTPLGFNMLKNWIDHVKMLAAIRPN